MSETFKRRRRRMGSDVAPIRPSQHAAMANVQPVRVGLDGVAACGAVVVVGLALIALLWIVTAHVVQEQRGEIRDRAEQALIGNAAVIAETIAHELLMIDQSLMIIQSAWKMDSDSVDVAKWQKQMPALTAVTDDLFICDDRHVIRQDIVPRAIGQNVGAAYAALPGGALEQFANDGTKDAKSLVVQSETGSPIDARQFLMYIVRPLDHPKGWLLGASYRSTELSKLFAQAALGYNSVVALLDTKRGVLQAVVGPAARRPNVDLSKTVLFGIISRSATGTWVGETAIDGADRLHAFHQVADRNMVVLVAASMAEVMAPADNLAASARSVAFIATMLIMAIAGIVLRELYTVRRQAKRKRSQDRNRSELERLRIGEAENIARAELNASRLQVVLDHTTDGIALLDSDLRLVQWNHPFTRGIGVKPRKHMPLDTLLREQLAKGLRALTPDIEAEISRRIGILRCGDRAGLAQPGPDHEALTLRGLPIAEGGFMLLLNGLAKWEAPPLSTVSTESDVLAKVESTAAAMIEW